MNDFLQGRKVYRPLNGFASTIRDSENAALLPEFHPQTPERGVASTSPFTRHVTSEPAPTAESGSCGGGAPEIELVQTDGRIEQILVTCRCGERITLHCSY